MRKLVIVLVLLLLVLPIPARTATMPVPAVVTLGGGELVKLDIEVKQGSGQVYISTEPLVGIQTQSSARTAFNVAGELARVNTSKYDMLVNLRDYGGARSVDGPSGGAAMTLLMLSLLENKTVRGDLTMTGTIEKDGSIGEVGEVGKKTQAAVLGGMKVILIPKNYDMFDKMVFSILGQRWNISIIEVGNITDAAELAFTPQSVTLQSNVMETRPANKTQMPRTTIDCTSCYLQEFKQLATKIMDEDAAILEKLTKQNRSEFSYFLDAIESDLEQAADAEELNYLYSGANSAFLIGINLNFLNESNITYNGLKNRMVDVGNCIKTAEKPQVTKENFEWVGGGEERLAWSRKKLDDIEKQNYSSDDEETTLFLFKELLTADSWCQVSHEMFSVAEKIGGAPVNESNLKELASSRIEEADEKLKSFAGADFGDAGWRFEAARGELGNGSFVAAVFDSDYLISVIKMLNESADEDSFLDEQFNKSWQWDGMWAALYGNHAEYFYTRNKKGLDGAPSAMLLIIYADNLNNDTVRMRELFENPVVETTPPANVTATTEIPAGYQTELALLLVICVIMAIFLNVVQFFKAEK